ncbi:MAG: hypothetical protein IPO36_18740 [Anaerolineales bacterium]|nr:hypothetical protein [Anaerolineales bacterium]
MSIIYGERIRLRATEREDVKSFHAWVNDPGSDTLFIAFTSDFECG